MISVQEFMRLEEVVHRSGFLCPHIPSVGDDGAEILGCYACNDFTLIEAVLVKQAREITDAHHAVMAAEFVRALAEAAQ